MFRLCSDIVRKELLLTNHFAEGRSYQMMTKASLQITSSALFRTGSDIVYKVRTGSQRITKVYIPRNIPLTEQFLL